MKYKKEKMSRQFTKHLLTFEGKFKPFHAVLHHFSDVDKGGPHDHPWGFTTHILSGGYVEKVYTIDGDKWRSEIFFRQPGHVYQVAANCIHEIIELPEGECWTLVLPNHPEQKSGFYKFTEGGILRRFWDERKFKPL